MDNVRITRRTTQNLGWWVDLASGSFAFLFLAKLHSEFIHCQGNLFSQLSGQELCIVISCIMGKLTSSHFPESLSINLCMLSSGWCCLSVSSRGKTVLLRWYYCAACPVSWIWEWKPSSMHHAFGEFQVWALTDSTGRLLRRSLSFDLVCRVMALMISWVTWFLSFGLNWRLRMSG